MERRGRISLRSRDFNESWAYACDDGLSVFCTLTFEGGVCLWLEAAIPNFHSFISFVLTQCRLLQYFICNQTMFNQ